MVSSILIKREKLACDEAKFSCCAKCSGPLIEASFCTECRGIIDLICMVCGLKSTYDTHDFCYCQLDVLMPTGPKENLTCRY
ncbi:MAG: hypothetical protein ACRD91_05265 [Nitrosopumilaceae archaeon]